MRSPVLSSIVLLGTLWAANNQTAAPRLVRVLTYNIHHGEGTDRQFDLARLADIIKSAEPDLVALQEVDQGTARASGLNQLDELGRLTRMHTAFGKAMDFQGGGYGVGVLSRRPILSVQRYPLPGLPDREPRVALTVEVEIGENGPVVQFTSTHLDQGRDIANRVTQADFLNQTLALTERPGILAGDLNSRPDTEAMQVLNLQWINASPVEPQRDPTARPFGRVDHVLMRPTHNWRAIESTVVDAPVASDHRPLLIVLEWLPKP